MVWHVFLHQFQFHLLLRFLEHYRWLHLQAHRLYRFSLYLTVCVYVFSTCCLHHSMKQLVYAVRAAKHHDYEAFYRREIAEREHSGYPPLRRMINFGRRPAPAGPGQISLPVPSGDASTA